MFQYVSTLRSLSKVNTLRGQYTVLDVTLTLPISNAYLTLILTLILSLPQSKGRAQYSMELNCYDFVPPNVEKELSAKYAPAGGEDDE